MFVLLAFYALTGEFEAHAVTSSKDDCVLIAAEVSANVGLMWMKDNGVSFDCVPVTGPGA